MLQQLSLPLQLVNSDAHPNDTASLRKYCKVGYNIFYVPSTGHYPMIEKPELFNAALQSAIDAINKQ